MIIGNFLQLCARNGSLVLVLGLVAGITLPALANTLQPWLPILVGLILFANAFRIGWKTAAGSLSDIRETVVFVAILQLALPICVALVIQFFNLTNPLWLALIVMTSAASIGGSPNITQLAGHDPAPALRLLILGIALLPITAFIVFYFFFPLGEIATILNVSGRLIVLITIAAGLGFFIRQRFLPEMTEVQTQVSDGASIILMAVLVIGLMSALGPALTNEPYSVLFTVLAAFSANFGFQILTFYSMKAPRFAKNRVAVSVIAGNRNMALFLAALPLTVTEPIMLFIACYQIPMYLTPLFLKRFYSAASI